MSRSPRPASSNRRLGSREIYWQWELFIAGGLCVCVQRWYGLWCDGVCSQQPATASESGETGEKGWLWGVAWAVARRGWGIADGSGGRIDDKGECVGRWDCGRQRQALEQRPCNAARQRRDCVCAQLLCPPDPACFSRISALFSCTFFWEIYPVLSFFDFGHRTATV